MPCARASLRLHSQRDHSAIISSPLPGPGQFSRTPDTAWRRAPLERLFDLFPKAEIPNRVAAVRGSSDLTQQLSVEVGCKQSSIRGESVGLIGTQCKIFAVRREPFSWQMSLMANQGE